MNTTLKPCPFCGGEKPDLYSVGTGFGDDWCVLCPTYGASTKGTCESRDEAVSRWNMRTERMCGEWRGWPTTNPSGFHDDDAELWCEHCDIELDDGWAYCPSCGAKVVDECVTST